MSSKTEAAARVKAGAIEVFTFVDDAGVVTRYNVSETRRLLIARDPALGRCDLVPVSMSDFMEYLYKNRDFCNDRVASLTEEEMQEPPMFARCPDGSFLLLDGIHRLIRMHRAGATEAVVWVLQEPSVPRLIANPFMVERPWGRSLQDMHEERSARLARGEPL